jgi:hypothetical protein
VCWYYRYSDPTSTNINQQQQQQQSSSYPSLEQAFDRLRYLRQNEPSWKAFSFAPPKDATTAQEHPPPLPDLTDESQTDLY